MSKRSPASHPDDSDGKKTRIDGQGLPTDEELERMSVREKLFTGIAFGFARDWTQPQQQHDSAPKHHNFAPVATLQLFSDGAFHVRPSVCRSVMDAADSETMMFHKEREEELWGMVLAEQRQILTDHFDSRMSQRRATSRRLHAIMRLVNDNPFAPPGGDSDGQRLGEQLRIFLHSACRKHGYRRLELDFLGFLKMNVTRDIKGQPLGSAPVPSTPESLQRVCFEAKKGSLLLYECDVSDEQGRVTTWMWLQICRLPAVFEQAKHCPKPDVPKDQLGWIIIAIPKSQIDTLEDAWHLRSPSEVKTTGDFMMENLMPPYMKLERAQAQSKKRMGLAFRYSRDGVPCVASSKKAGDVDSPWFGVRTGPDGENWETVHKAMRTNTCLVHAYSKPGAEWVTVAPEKLRQPEKS